MERELHSEIQRLGAATAIKRQLLRLAISCGMDITKAVWHFDDTPTGSEIHQLELVIGDHMAKMYFTDAQMLGYEDCADEINDRCRRMIADIHSANLPSSGWHQSFLTHRGNNT